VSRTVWRLCVLAGLLFLSYEASALDPHKTIAQYAHEVWNAKKGLPEADVMAILQTRDGYLWVGTEEGLARFDGTHFTVFDRKNTALPNNRIQALAETPDGSLWIGTENGLSRLHDHQVTNYSVRDGLPSNTIRALWAESNGALWVTTVAGVRVWRNQGFAREPSIEKTGADNPRQILRTANGDTWIAGDMGVTMVGARAAAGPKRVDGKAVRVMMMERGGGVLWIGSTSGLYRLMEGKIRPYPLGGHASHPEVTALLQDGDGNVWVGTLGDGLFRISKSEVQHYSVADGLSAVEVKSLFEDSTGNLWVGTFGGGLDVFRDTMFTPYGKPEGVSEEVVWTVMEGRDSSIWIGTQGGGLNRIKDGKVTVYSTREGFTDNTVGSLLEGRDGTVWLGKDSGLSRFSKGRLAGARLASFPLHEQIHSIYEDPSGAIWIGTRTSGLIMIRGAKYTRLTTRDGLADNNVQVIIPSRGGGMWIGTLGGLSHYQNGKFKNLTSKDGLSADQVVSLYEDAEGTLWIGTDGLNRLKNGKITTYGDREGLFDQNPLAILEDDGGYLWLSTNKGIFRVSKQQLNDLAEKKTNQLTPVAFGIADGMRNAECNGGSSPAGWKDSKGNLWFATVAGAVKVDPRWAAANSHPLQVHVEGMWADRKSVERRGSLRLPPGGHELEFHYSAPYFAGADRVRYRYQLEGFDKEWIDAGTRTVAYYTNLPPGNYRFQVNAWAFNALPEEVEAEISFYLTPHFYQTPVFYIEVALALLALILLIWMWTNRYMIARQNELKQLVKARTRELEAEKAELLEAKAALAQQASHDSLTGLLNRKAILEVLEQEMIRSARERSSLAILLADLDHFKNVNDTYGHLVGDQVLREFARQLRNDLRPYDHAGRFGGEEFLIVMPGFEEGGEERIGDLQRQLCLRSMVSPNMELTVTCSIGVAWLHGAVSTESLLKQADQALYAAKANGRNRVEMAGKLPKA
jgi:diguanylate cyclase (GGDEF)-like protein